MMKGYRLGYAAGLVMLAGCTLLYLVGFGGVQWTKYEADQAVLVQGTDSTDRWRLCVQDSCFAIISDDGHFSSALKTSGSWETALSHGLWRFCTTSGCYTIVQGVSKWTQAFECISLVSLLLSIVMGVIVCFFSDRCLQSRSRLPEIVAAFGSLTGLVGALILMGSKYNEIHNNTVQAPLGWSFTLAVFATFGGLVSASMLTYFNQFVPAKRPYFLLTPDKIVQLGQRNAYQARPHEKSAQVYTIPSRY